MSASSAIIGRGTFLAHSDSVDGTYTPLLELTKLNPPKQAVKDVDVTHYLSPNNTKEYIPGVFIDPGLVEYEANYIQSDRDAVKALLGVPAFWRITMPDAAGFKFAGFLKDLSDDLPNEDKMMTKAQIKVTGPVNFIEAITSITLTSPQDGMTIDPSADRITLVWTSDTGYTRGEVILDAGTEGETSLNFGDTPYDIGTMVDIGIEDTASPHTLLIRINGVDSNTITVTGTS
jgi:hypothetical protein